jgi:hypothetical protein
VVRGVGAGAGPRPDVSPSWSGFGSGSPAVPVAVPVGAGVLGWPLVALVAVGVGFGLVEGGVFLTAAQVAEATLMVAACVPRPAATWTCMPMTVVEPSWLVVRTS